MAILTLLCFAAVSPSSSCYNETVNTLRFGQRAKLIVSHPLVIEDSKENIIRKLKVEVERLRELLKLSQLPQNFISVNKDEWTNEEQSRVKQRTQECNNYLSPSESDEIFTELKQSHIFNSCLIQDNKRNFMLQQNAIDIKIDSLEGTLKDNNTPSDNLTTKCVTGCQISNQATETLLPLITVTSSLKPTPTKLKRTYSNNQSNAKTGNRNLKINGSEGHIPSLESTKTSSSFVNFPKQNNGFGNKNYSFNSPTDYRKPLNTLSNTILRKELPRKNSRNIDLFVDKHKSILHKNVQSLHPKIRKKKDDINTSDKNSCNNNLRQPNELNGCLINRIHFRTQTNEFVKVNRHKHEETQTELSFPLLCSKENAIDNFDLRLHFPEVTNVATPPDIKETKNVSIQCILFKPNQTLNHQYPLNKEENVLSPKLKYSNHTGVSINYLQEGQNPPGVFYIVSPNRYIYKNSTNINILYKPNENIPDDGTSHNSFLLIPDIINNQDYLKQTTGDNSECSNISQKTSQPMHFGETEILKDNFISIDGIVPVLGNNTYVTAKKSLVPKHTENITSINMLTVQAPEICLKATLDYAYCGVLPAFKPELVKPEVIEYKCVTNDFIKLETLHTDKFIFQHCANCFEGTTYKLQNPLNCPTNNKKATGFKHNQPENQRTHQALSGFFNEAVQLMKNITVVTQHLNRCYNSLPRDFDELNITLDDKSETKQSKIKNLKKQLSQLKKNSTYSMYTKETDSTLYNSDYMIPVNKYESLVEESCRRLEEKINISTFDSKFDISNGDTCYTISNGLSDSFSEFGNNPWDLSHPQNDIDIEDSSLESNPVTYSDYGSLPRRSRKRHRIPTCSSTAFLRQLTNMRNQIIESSREELLGFSSDI